MKFILADAVNNFANSLKNILDAITPIAWVLVAIALAINGVMIMVGGDEGRQKAKKALPFVAVGCIIFMGAVQIGKWVAGLSAF